MNIANIEPMEPDGQRKSPVLNKTMTILNKYAMKDRDKRYIL